MIRRFICWLCGLGEWRRLTLGGEGFVVYGTEEDLKKLTRFITSLARGNEEE